MAAIWAYFHPNLLAMATAVAPVKNQNGLLEFADPENLLFSIQTRNIPHILYVIEISAIDGLFPQILLP